MVDRTRRLPFQAAIKLLAHLAFSTKIEVRKLVFKGILRIVWQHRWKSNVDSVQTLQNAIFQNDSQLIQCPMNDDTYVGFT